jgi:hypothetical protein
MPDTTAPKDTSGVAWGSLREQREDVDVARPHDQEMPSIDCVNLSQIPAFGAHTGVAHRRPGPGRGPPPRTPPATSSSTPYAHPANAAWRSSRPDGPPCNESAYTPGESAPSPPQHSSSQPLSEAATEKTSLVTRPRLLARLGERPGNGSHMGRDLSVLEVTEFWRLR